MNNKNAHHQHYGNREFNLFVGDLPYDCSDDKLQRIYQTRFKSVRRVQIIRNEDGSSRGFGFVRFEELAEFEKALAEGMKIDNITLRVDTAHRKEHRARIRYNSFNSQHNAHHNLFSSSQQKNNQHHAGSETVRNIKQSNSSQGGDDPTVSMPQPQNKQPQPQQQQPQQHPTRPSTHQPSPQQAQQTTLPQSQNQQNMTQINSNAIGVATPNASTNIEATTTAVTSLSNSDIPHSTSALPNSQLNVNAGQPSLAPDMRGFAHPGMMDNPHMMGATEPSVMPPSSVYGHLYPYAPPPFGYMIPPPGPNPVIPISAVPPAPPNQPSSGGVGQQHSLAGASASGGRYNSGHHQQQHHPHLAQQSHASTPEQMTAASVQGPPTHQAPFYYYYPHLYFDQTGGTAPPNLYHPHSFHPQFFSPNPAYLPNAHPYTNQHQAQPPLASQSDATAPLVNQQRPQPQSHQQQVNLRTRDIDAPIE